MAFSDRELAEKLARVPDSEIEQYHKQRLKDCRKFYYLGVICGIGAIPFIFINLTWIGAVLGILGLGLVQSGRYKREKWRKTYHYLIYHRNTQLKKNQDFAELTKNEGSKYKNAKEKLKKSESSK
jgi:hypothetical protein